MYVNHSGWNEKDGFFNYNIFVDENKKDYEIHYKSGVILRQNGPFEVHTQDWNHDGDVYSLFGAYFDRYEPDGKCNSAGFWTPEQMVSELIEGLEESSSSYYDKVVEIPGIELPGVGKRPSLESQIRESERHKMAQDIERNRKMDALGIRHPGDPWVK